MKHKKGLVKNDNRNSGIYLILNHNSGFVYDWIMSRKLKFSNTVSYNPNILHGADFPYLLGKIKYWKSNKKKMYCNVYHSENFNEDVVWICKYIKNNDVIENILKIIKNIT